MGGRADTDPRAAHGRTKVGHDLGEGGFGILHDNTRLGLGRLTSRNVPGREIDSREIDSRDDGRSGGRSQKLLPVLGAGDEGELPGGGPRDGGGSGDVKIGRSVHLPTDQFSDLLQRNAHSGILS